MNETKLVIFGLIALVIVTILLWILDEPEILVDKEIEVVIALGVGILILILILDKRATHRVHKMLHKQHLLIDEVHKQINEQNEIIKNMQKMSSTYEGHMNNNNDSK